MSWLTLPRRPEPEVMHDAEDVDAYASAAAQAYLDAIDNTLVEHVLSLGRASGWLLDLGTGPGQIPLKIARRLPGLRVVGVDCSLNMIRAARRAAAEQGLEARSFFLVGDGNRLCFPDGFFDVVLSNSVLHHLADPVTVINEMTRVAKPDGLVLARDLRRPGRLTFPFHVGWYGRHYSGLMKKLFVDSVRAAYSGEELAELLERSRLAGARVFYHQRTHLGFVRDGHPGGSPARPVAPGNRSDIHKEEQGF
ncbi:MAG: class I SAM-dependent methyltransferase [Acidobacteriia bacterium]|nr:class I SAM-dependent methyltransferase [Terriglobia bacterium]